MTYIHPSFVNRSVASVILACLFLGSFNLFGQTNQKKDAFLGLWTNDLNAAAGKIQDKVQSLGGQISSQSRTFNTYESSINLSLSLPAKNLPQLFAFVRGLGTVTSESSFYQQGADIQNVQINISDRKSAYDRPRVGLYAGVSGGLVNLTGFNEKDHGLFAAGLTVGFPRRSSQLSLLMLNGDQKLSDDPEEPAVKGSSLVSISHSTYSSALGGGANRYLNPYAGVLYGYTYVARKSAFLLGAKLGIELFSSDYFILAFSGSLAGLYGHKSGGTMQMYLLNLDVPF